MHPDLYERRRSLNIERFAAAREWGLEPREDAHTAFGIPVEDIRASRTVAFNPMILTRLTLRVRAFLKNFHSQIRLANLGNPSSHSASPVFGVSPMFIESSSRVVSDPNVASNMVPGVQHVDKSHPPILSMFSLVTRSILIGVATLAVFIGLALPVVYGQLPGWESVTGVAAVLAVCAIAWAVDSREV